MKTEPLPVYIRLGDSPEFRMGTYEFAEGEEFSLANILVQMAISVREFEEDEGLV